MSTEKEKLSHLLKKVDEITVTLNKVSEELRTVSASLKSLAVGQITAPPATPNTAPPKTLPASQAAQTGSPNLRSLDEIRMSFPEELETRLSFEEKGDHIIIKPKQFLGSENFAKIASAIRGMGGEYISAGKDSHFRVAKKKA
ncbi:MAG TPA: hypothetical protein VLL96_00430 [Candidatus Deferrimicrobiaceae bacterium]|nr:hypothetical protein [Candidatus Deferrimicrobiaceae bacterium]